jgi:hypothetical protein
LCSFQQVSLGWPDQEIDGGWGMWHVWGEEKCIQGFRGETWRLETTWEDVGINGGIMLKWTLKTEWKRVEGIKLAQDRLRWRAFLNMVMNARIP